MSLPAAADAARARAVSLFPPETYRRLRAIGATDDPGELFAASRPVPPAGR
jgi:hypothetical protein